MLNFCDFIQVYVFTTNHHLKYILKCIYNYNFQLNSNIIKFLFSTFLIVFVILIIIFIIIIIMLLFGGEGVGGAVILFSR